MLQLIFARTRNRVIGDKGRLPWDLPEELAFYERMTRGHTVVIGRRTYFDQPTPFPDRQTIVVTRNPELAVASGVMLATSLSDALGKATGDIFVAGGAALFMEALPLAVRAFETVIDVELDGDTLLPPMDFSDWATQTIAHHPADARHAYPFTVLQHDR